MPKRPVINGSVVTFDGINRYDISGIHSIDDTPEFISKQSETEVDVVLNASTIPYDESGLSLKDKLDEMANKPTAERVQELLESYSKTVTINGGDPISPVDGIADIDATYQISSDTLQKLLIISQASQKIIVNGEDIIPVNGAADIGDIDAGSYIKPSSGVPVSDLQTKYRQDLANVDSDKLVSKIEVGAGQSFELVEGDDVDLTSLFGALYKIQREGIPLSDFTTEAQAQIVAANTASRKVLVCGTYYYPDENGIVDLGNSGDVSFPGVIVLSGGIVNNTNPKNPVATATITLDGNNISTKPNVFEIPSEDALDFELNGKNVTDILSEYESGGIQKIIINLKEYDVNNSVADIPSIKQNADGVISLTGNAVDVNDPTTSSINAYVKIGNKIITPHNGIFTITTNDILNSITPNFKFYFDSIEGDLLHGIELDGVRYTPNENHELVINTDGSHYIPPIGGISNPDIATSVLSALAERTTGTIKGVKIGNTIYRPEYGAVRLLKAYQLGENGFGVNDMDPDVIDTLTSAADTVQEVDYNGSSFLTDSNGVMDISPIRGYELPAGNIPMGDLATPVQDALNKPAGSVVKIQVGSNTENTYEKDANGIIDIGTLQAFEPPVTGIPMTMLTQELQDDLLSLAGVIQRLEENGNMLAPSSTGDIPMTITHTWTADESSVTMTTGRILSLKQTVELPNGDKAFDSFTSENLKYSDTQTVKDEIDILYSGILTNAASTYVTTITYENVGSIIIGYPNPFETDTIISIDINDQNIYSNVSQLSISSLSMMMDSTQNRAETVSDTSQNGTLTIHGLWYPGINKVHDVSSLIGIYAYADRPSTPTLPISIIGLDSTDPAYVGEPTINVTVSW